jgi:hypothetical protein
MVGKSGVAEEGGAAAAAAVRRWVEAGGGRLVMDGGLATELEANGADLNDPLWSAKCLLSSPHLVRKVSPQSGDHLACVLPARYDSSSSLAFGPFCFVSCYLTNLWNWSRTAAMRSP